MRLAVALSLLAALPACDLDLDKIFDIPPPDCEAFVAGPWRVTLPLEELQVGESMKGRVTPGLPLGCDDTITAVTWGIEDGSVASVQALGARNPRSETAGSIAQAWVSGTAPGSTRVVARIQAADGAVFEAQPGTVNVVEPGPRPRHTITVARGTTDVRFNEFTGGGTSDLIPVVLPSRGKVEVAIDWTSFRRNLGFFLWQGTCAEVPCPGELVINAQMGAVKPRREIFDDAHAGDYTLRIFGETPLDAGGSSPETASYEVLLIPR
jgi:hypothetical protein